MKIKGIYVPIRGDYDQLQRDMNKARRIVSEQAKGMSNALNNALSPTQTQQGINKLIANLGTLSRASQVTGKSFGYISADLGSLRKNLGVTEAQFASLQKRLLNTSAERAQERALRNIAKAANLTESEIRALGAQMNLSKRQMSGVINSLNKVNQSAGASGRGIGNAFTNATANVFAFQYAVEAAFRILNAAVFNFNATLEVAQIGMASAFLTQGQYVDQLTGKVLEGEQAFAAGIGEAVRTTELLKAANLQTIATLEQLIKGYQVTLPVALAKGFNNDQVVQFTLAMIQAAGAIDDTGALMHQLGEETRSLLTEAINPRTSRIATALGIRNEDIRQYRGNADELFNFLMGKLSAYQVAGEKLQSTWKGVWSNFIDIAQQASAMAFEPLFDAVKFGLKEIVDEIVVLDSTTKQMKWNPEFLDGVKDFRDDIYAIVAELYRFGMLLDKIGGTLTTIGALGTFGSWDDKMREWNKMYDERYWEGDRRLQELANRQLGLNSDGTSKTSNVAADYLANPPKPDEDAAAGLKKLNDARLKELDALRAFEEKEAAIIRGANELQLQINEQGYEWGLRALEDYLEQKHALLVANVDAEIAAKKKEVEAARKTLQELTPEVDKDGNPSPGKDRIAKASAQKEIYDAERQLAELETQRAMLVSRNANETKRALFDQSAGYKQISLELLNLTGQTIAAQEAQKELYYSSKEYLQLEAEAASGNLLAVKALADVKQQMAVMDQQVALEHRAMILDDAQAVAALTGEWREYYQTQVDILEVEIARARATGQQTGALEAMKTEAEKMLDPMSALAKGFDDVALEWGDAAAVMVELGEDTAHAMHDAFSDIFFDALEGEFKDLSDYAQALLTSINRAIANALASSFVSSMSGSGGLLSGLAEMFHTGGTVGVDSVASRRVSPAMFVGAPRYHDGLLPDEFPAILKRGETVFTPGQLKSLIGAMPAQQGGAGGSMSVNVPISVSGGMSNETIGALKAGIESTVMDILRREM